jgi:hypothetical protein
MSDSKRKDEISTSTKSNPTTSVIDAAKENTLRIIDEVAKVQPQYSQALSNLQTDFIQTARNFVQTSFDAQRQVSQNINFPQNAQVSELVARQSNEVASNVIRAIGTYNQLAINVIDAAREDTKIYNRTVDAVTDFNTNIVKAWTTYWTTQQQQFTRAF